MNNIGVLFSRLEEYGKSKRYFRESLAIRTKYNDQAGIANVLNNIGILYQKEDSLNKALDAFNKALEIKTQFEDKYAISFYINQHWQCLF